MGRPFRDVAVVKAYAADGSFVAEDIVPLAEFRSSGARLLSSAQVRRQSGVRSITLRFFNSAGVRIMAKGLCYNLAGEPVERLIRRPDGSIIEDADRYV